MSRTTNTRRAHTLLLDATVTATLIEPALTNLELGRNGYPTSTHGASPDTPAITPVDPDADTRPGAGIPHDTARQDLDQLQEHLRKAAHHTARAAHIITAWGNRGLDQTTITSRLTAIDAGIWCANCITHGHHTPKRPKGTLCEFCAGFRSDWKRLPSKRILEVRTSRGGRIYVTDIRRIHREQDEERKRVKEAERVAAKAAKHAAKAAS